jgi:hypothetical protein
MLKQAHALLIRNPPFNTGIVQGGILMIASRQLFSTLLFCGFASLAHAQDSQPSSTPTPTPQPTPAPIAALVEQGGPPQTGFQLQARMSTQLGLASLITPGFSMGYRTGKVVISAELGVTAGQASFLDPVNGDDSISGSLIHVMPAISYDFWQSSDGRARLNFIGGIGFGVGKVTEESSFDDDGDPATPLITSTFESSATFLPTLAGIGGDYYLHRNFAVGVEAGAQLPILLSSQSENDGVVEEIDLNAGAESLHGMIRFTFVAGK